MHFGGHSFSQIWQATQRKPACQSGPSYTRNGNTRVASGRGARSSGYSTVVNLSFETKLPAKFFAVSASPFRIPSPSNTSSAPILQSMQISQFNPQVAVATGCYRQRTALSIHFSQHNVYTSENQHHIGDIVAQAHVLEDRQVDQAWRAHAIPIWI